MDLAAALAPEPGVKWIIGRVTAVTGNTLTMNYRGGDITDVGVLDSYIPVVGDVVHVLASDLNGMIAIGSNNQTVAPTPIPTPASPVAVHPSSVATYQMSTSIWTPGVVVESPDQVGCWFYPSFNTVSRTVLPAAGLTINITAQTGAPLEFVPHSMTAPLGPLVLAGPTYRCAPPPIGVPTDVQLPIGWAAMLLSGQASGVGAGGGGFYTADLTGSSGVLTFTPLL